MSYGKFFYPRSVAVVGVSDNPANLAQGIVANLLKFGYQGKIFPVGPRGGPSSACPSSPAWKTCPRRWTWPPSSPRPGWCPKWWRRAAELGITRVVVESAGFSELNEEGRALEEEIRALLQHYRMRLVGPNGLGLINMEIGLALPFASLSPPPRKGRIAIISQSGGVGSHLFAWMAKEGLGLNKFLSLGNRLDVAENEVLAYLLERPRHPGHLSVPGRGAGRPGTDVPGPAGRQTHLSPRPQRGAGNRGHRPFPYRFPGHG